MHRGELLAIPGIGVLTLQLLDRLLGAPIPEDPAERHVAYWTERGLPPGASRSLQEAGIRTVEDLQERSREVLESIPSVGVVVIARLEELAGRLFPRRISVWAAKGLPRRIDNVLTKAGVHRESDVLAMTREQALALEGMSGSALGLIESAVGQTLRSPINDWVARGITMKLGRRLVGAEIESLRDLRELSIGDLRGLGFDWTEIAHCETVKEKGRLT